MSRMRCVAGAVTLAVGSVGFGLFAVTASAQAGGTTAVPKAATPGAPAPAGAPTVVAVGNTHNQATNTNSVAQAGVANTTNISNIQTGACSNVNNPQMGNIVNANGNGQTVNSSNGAGNGNIEFHTNQAACNTVVNPTRTIVVPKTVVVPQTVTKTVVVPAPTVVQQAPVAAPVTTTAHFTG